MKNDMNLAVVILNYNDSENTIRYVNEIKNYKCINRIVVIDNKSPDNSFDKLKKLASKNIDVIISENNKGYAYGNNYAIRYLNEKYGKYKYIVISNPDVHVEEDAYNKCINFLEKNKEVAIVAPRMFDINNNPHQLSGWKLRSLKGDIMDSSPALTTIFQKPHIERYSEDYLSQSIAYVDCIAGSFFAIRHSAFEEVGYFDEKTFLYFEEDILGNKLNKLGYKNVVLNTCKFNHFESVTIDKNMNQMRKFKNLQKSKIYYHKTYNIRCNKFHSKWKLLPLYIVTFLRPVEEKLRINKLVTKIKYFSFKRAFKKYFGANKDEFLIRLTKLFILFIQTLLLPYTFISKKLRRKPKVLYFSLVTWKWIKQRPHFVPLEIAKSKKYKVDYRYQTLYDKYMPKDANVLVKNDIKNVKNFRIKPFKILPANTRKNILKNTIKNILRTSFWNYDTIIITQPNQMDFFFMKVNRLKKVNFIYEAMDNYEAWEQNKEGYLKKQQSLIYNSKHVIVSSQKLKDKFTKMYNLDDTSCTVIRNGYDKATFKNWAKEETNLKHPNVTYIGTIDDWFDFDNVVAYAKKHKDIYFNIIGPVNPSVKERIANIKEKNISFPGPIEHHLVPQYINDSDVMMMPFLLNDVIEYVDPVKVYEYLYMKRPVVTSYWEELKQFEGLVNFYKNGDFEKVMDKAIKSEFKETDKYKKLIKESSWENRLKDFIAIIERIR